MNGLEHGKTVSMLSVALGAHNLFNRYPNGLNPELLAIYGATLNTTAVRYYPDFSAIGINGSGATSSRSTKKPPMISATANRPRTAGEVQA